MSRLQLHRRRTRSALSSPTTSDAVDPDPKPPFLDPDRRRHPAIAVPFASTACRDDSVPFGDELASAFAHRPFQQIGAPKQTRRPTHSPPAHLLADDPARHHEPSDDQAHHPPTVASTSSTPTRQRPIQLTASAYSSSIQQRSGIPTPPTEQSTEAATPPQNKKIRPGSHAPSRPRPSRGLADHRRPHVTPQASHRTAPISSTIHLKKEKLAIV
ncbi:hypothetical protein ACLOJK_041367 [Asimina triloba]